MQIEWDEARRASNLDKHGFDFADMVRFDWDSAILLPGDVVDFEIRHREIGKLDAATVYVVYTMRDDTARIISLRKATRAEARFYVQNT